MELGFSNEIFDEEEKKKKDSSIQRIICEKCERPFPDHCICSSFPENPIEIQTEVIILQHPKETRVFRTVPIIERCLGSKCTVYRGRKFEEDLYPLLHKQLQDPSTFLLYPTKEAKNAEFIIKNKETETQVKRLVVLDGTWIHAKKLFNWNPKLGTISHVKISSVPNSTYLRKQTQKGNLSTVEAVAFALGILEENPDISNQLLKPFHYMMDLQRNFVKSLNLPEREK
ncbi:dtw domain-containing protein [Anaeramoeba ignava]|uniref:tRNA-uridine aminocarboxypropyltransferase n=1 Tax=Anaeramoeba ignava TaxID=1746090 RepID=A0A9Q0RBJ4_ANAIG|nr:dtw domain-containing protein [Anaeramoeba ignava]